MRLQDLPLVTPATPSMPKYRQIAAVIEEYLARSRPAAGEKFFTDRALAKYFSTTTITVAHSLNYLCSKGLMTRKVGSGTFIGNSPALRAKPRIGIVCHEMIQGDESYVTPVLRRFGAFFSTHGYEVISFCADSREYRRLVDEYELAGVMVFVPRPEFAPAILRLHNDGAAVVSIGYAIPDLEGISFGTDHEKSLSAAVAYLYQLGHRRIALLHTADHASSGVFSRGYQKAMWAHRLPLHPDWDILISREGATPAEAIARKLLRLAELDAMPSAVILGKVAQAAPLYSFAQRNGIRIPEDLSLIGLGDAEFVQHLTPPLTVMSQNLDAIADNAAGALLDKIAGRADGGWFSAIAPILQERASCAPAPTDSPDNISKILKTNQQNLKKE